MVCPTTVTSRTRWWHLRGLQTNELSWIDLRTDDRFPDDLGGADGQSTPPRTPSPAPADDEPTGQPLLSDDGNEARAAVLHGLRQEVAQLRECVNCWDQELKKRCAGLSGALTRLREVTEQ